MCLEKGQSSTQLHSYNELTIFANCYTNH